LIFWHTRLSRRKIKALEASEKIRFIAPPQFQKKSNRPLALPFNGDEGTQGCNGVHTALLLLKQQLEILA
jgi:hypothetical protein